MSGWLWLAVGVAGGLLVGARWVRHKRAWADWRGLVKATAVAREVWWRAFQRLAVSLLLAAVFLASIIYLKQTGRPS